MFESFNCSHLKAANKKHITKHTIVYLIATGSINVSPKSKDDVAIATV